MDSFAVHILGCGSALPTTKHFPSSQVVNLHNKLYMVDCGEGAQLQFRASRLKFQRLNHIFISHLHGDHCFGLLGLTSTLGLIGRTSDLYIHAPFDAEASVMPLLKFFCNMLPYKIHLLYVNSKESELIFEDKTLKVTSIPLNHRVPTAGFLFEEKQRSPHIIREMIDFYRVPISQIRAIKDGAPFITGDGEIIPNTVFTQPADPPRKYAYCSDTAYEKQIVPIIAGVNTLYHEATFCTADLARAKETFHSSAVQAASIAKAAKVGRLVIGHFSARYPNERILLNEAREIFPETQLAYERMIIKI